MTGMGSKLKQRLSQKDILIAPGAHDVLTAKIIEDVGFEAVYMTGYGSAASILGQPDVGLLTQVEMATRARNIVERVNIPVIADADTGFGNAINVIRTTRLYEDAGVAMMQLEDQIAPKKCGHMLGREVVPPEEMVGKIQAACDARRGDMLIMARTDARTNYGLDEAIRRGKAYEQAGADVLFIESVESEEEMRIVTRSFNVPVLANMLEHGRTPLLPAPKLQEIGYRLVIFCVASVYAEAYAVTELMKTLKQHGTTESFLPKMIPFEEFNRLTGLPEIRLAEEKYKTGRKASY
ncbi:carboxyvinyl-carboxyphosphonate phosphorylmutase [Brenneria goodwinii]|uniref:2-methylisocitrate lyase n=2 Tax=Brenneria goodwinii TaxID=1109412 RepID=A0A0G4JZE4_9GAMM|nr:isocitrate lyase/PEP mutase family protein [Gibbsiella quercinecans]RLM05386.1 carboxyvinyl-carboxyphosphonate phosphorylmutase [Gibbsiella quercinecans]RLM20135.1 carboxyvinyl-carboxyphosphonate phosphorylmutase [Brenneria goodwinii]CPR19012.1 Methylisocitrate lyase [Brenneria goodwinii]